MGKIRTGLVGLSQKWLLWATCEPILFRRWYEAKVMGKIWLIAGLLGTASTGAWAQSGAPGDAPGEMRVGGVEVTPTVTATTGNAPVNKTEVSEDGLLDQYHRATMNLAVGDVAEAKRVLKQLIATGATHSLSQKAQEILEILNGPAGLSKLLEKKKEYDIPAAPKVVTTKPVATNQKEVPTGLARGELAFTQTVHGLVLGLEFCALLQCNEPRAFIGSILVGAGAGLAGSFVYEADGIKPGQAAAINSGTYWGGWMMLSMGMGLDLVRDSQTLAGLLMLGQLGGLTAGALLYDAFEPTSGEVSMVNSAGIWSGVLTAMTLNLAEVNGQTDYWLPMFLITHAAGAGAAYLSRTYSMSRGRVLLIDGVGLMGGLIGASAVVLTAGNDTSSDALQTSIILGIAGGLTIGTYLSREFDAPDIGANLALVPTEGGALLTLGSTF